MNDQPDALDSDDAAWVRARQRDPGSAQARNEVAAPRGPAVTPPVRLCCGQAHYGTICPDGLVMCCLCFNRFPVEELAVDDGYFTDVCQLCWAKEGHGGGLEVD